MIGRPRATKTKVPMRRVIGVMVIWRGTMKRRFGKYLVSQTIWEMGI